MNNDLEPQNSLTSIVDARGLKCPLPVIKVERAAQNLSSGDTLTVLATDPMAKIDIPLYCQQNGFSCTISEQTDHLSFYIQRQ